MGTRTAVDQGGPAGSACWCCGATYRPDAMVHLGNHPEVVVCVGCAHWLGKQAWQIEDRSRSGPLVAVRTQFRSVRAAVIRRGWYRNPVFGRPIRWLGKRLP